MSAPQLDSTPAQHPPYSNGPSNMQQGYPPPGYGAHPSMHAMPHYPAPQMSWSGTRGNHKFTLEVVQQPDRARMCGFGDKDRRPITPPPCIRLKVTDLTTGQEIDASQLNSQCFILQVDLWNESATAEVNLVRHANNAPSISISMSQTTRFPPPPEMTMPPAPFMPGGANEYMYPRPSMAQAANGSWYPTGPSYGTYQTSSGMFTRNLIGSTTVSASELEDPDHKKGLWFVLQDLSVRQEGNFRLKLNFIDVGGETPGTLNTGSCAVLAYTFTDVFAVWSAKKFPGVKESTTLSKCFAQQGVKIPIRKDSKGKDDKDDDDY